MLKAVILFSIYENLSNILDIFTSKCVLKCIIYDDVFTDNVGEVNSKG